jgi:hypothetical protein
MRKTAILIIVIVVAGSLTGAAPGRAQSSKSFTDVPDRFRLEAGGFRIGADTKLTLNRGGNVGTVDFESDLDLNENANRAYFEAFWRAGRRHLLSVAYQGLNREGGGVTLERTINWGDQVFPVGITATGVANSDYVSGVYRFAAYRNDRFEIGPALGFGYLWVEAGIDATTTVGGVTTRVSESATSGNPTGNLGAYLYVWPARRVLVRGDMRYILVKPENAEASIVEGKAALLWHPWSRIAIGLQYTYTKFRYDRGILDTSLGGSLRFSGGQVVAGYVF